MQKGFASLEIILTVMIIALLATVAVPNAARILDKVALDYERKRLYSELQFLRTFDRSANVDATGLNMPNFFVGKKKTIRSVAIMNFDFYANSYQIFRGGKPVREPHYLSYGVTFSDETEVPKQIQFDAKGTANVNSKTIVLKSPRGYTTKLRFDSVGRIRGD